MQSQVPKPVAHIFPSTLKKFSETEAVGECYSVAVGNVDEISVPVYTEDCFNQSGLAYGIVDPDYARVYTQARIIAWQYGYACVMHGSFTRDLDLLLVPWTEEAQGNGEQMLKLIAEACDLRFSDRLEETYKSKVDWTEKPHGRQACSLYFPRFGDRRWIDISIMPHITKEVK